MSAENQNMPYEIYDVKYLPIVSHYARKLGIVELLDKLVPSEMTVSVGDFVLAMILDTLSGRTPLYHLEQFFEGQNTELLLGKKISTIWRTVLLKIGAEISTLFINERFFFLTHLIF